MVLRRNAFFSFAFASDLFGVPVCWCWAVLFYFVNCFVILFKSNACKWQDAQPILSVISAECHLIRIRVLTNFFYLFPKINDLVPAIAVNDLVVDHFYQIMMENQQSTNTTSLLGSTITLWLLQWPDKVWILLAAEVLTNYFDPPNLRLKPKMKIQKIYQLLLLTVENFMLKEHRQPRRRRRRQSKLIKTQPKKQLMLHGATESLNEWTPNHYESTKEAT